jgi:predicted O-linked N-acetylglucosamine transferase (SPINDLY family)
LPEEGFVFCAFNNNNKITPAMFATWMQLLLAIPGSVLWLRAARPLADEHLREAAQRQGVDPARLRFAARVDSMADHLARYRQADLFIDAFPYTAHSTAHDALWAGLPVLTCRGRALASRVAASLLKAVGLPELITDSLGEYFARAQHLANNPADLTALRARLEPQRVTSPLFDVQRYCRHFENALVEMYRRHERGLPRAGFRVAPQTQAKGAGAGRDPTAV